MIELQLLPGIIVGPLKPIESDSFRLSPLDAVLEHKVILVVPVLRTPVLPDSIMPLFMALKLVLLAFFVAFIRALSFLTAPEAFLIPATLDWKIKLIVSLGVI